MLAYDDRTLVIRITMYGCIFVMLSELRTGGGAILFVICGSFPLSGTGQ